MGCDSNSRRGSYSRPRSRCHARPLLLTAVESRRCWCRPSEFSVDHVEAIAGHFLRCANHLDGLFTKSQRLQASTLKPSYAWVLGKKPMLRNVGKFGKRGKDLTDRKETKGQSHPTAPCDPRRSYVLLPLQQHRAPPICSKCSMPIRHFRFAPIQVVTPQARAGHATFSSAAEAATEARVHSNANERWAAVA